AEMKTITIELSAVLLAVFLRGCSQTPQPRTSSNGTENRSDCSRSPEPVSSSTQPPASKTGVISDSMCGANHAGMLKTGSMGADDVSCTLKCIEAGSHFVLVDTQSGKLYRLSDQVKPRAFAGKKVTVGGQVDEARRSI